MNLKHFAITSNTWFGVNWSRNLRFRNKYTFLFANAFLLVLNMSETICLWIGFHLTKKTI